MNRKSEIYKNSPLIETVFEIRFPPEPVIECHRDNFFNEIRGHYSKIMIPKSIPGKTMAFEPYRFESADGNNGIMLAINKLAFYCKNYEGFYAFKKEAIRIFRIFKDLFNIQEFQRAGLRYINIIPFVRENDMIPIENFLNMKIIFAKSVITDFKNISLIFVSPNKSGNSLATRIESVISQDKKQEGIILDFDCAKEGNLSFSQIDTYLEENHESTKDIFEQLITDNYKKVMRGDVIE